MARVYYGEAGSTAIGFGAGFGTTTGAFGVILIGIFGFYSVNAIFFGKIFGIILATAFGLIGILIAVLIAGFGTIGLILIAGFTITFLADAFFYSSSLAFKSAASYASWVA
jgi:hypothetical protein